MLRCLRRRKPSQSPSPSQPAETLDGSRLIRGLIALDVPQSSFWLDEEDVPMLTTMHLNAVKSYRTEPIATQFKKARIIL